MAFLKIEDFFLSSDDSDIRIRVQTDQDETDFEVPGHIFVLRRVSEVFKTMLESDKFKESKTKILGIKVKGDIKDGMSFLRYLYTGTLDNLDISSYVSILETAHLYDVTNLTELCERRIRQNVTPYSVCKMYVTLEKLVTTDCLNFFVDLMLKCAFLIFGNQLHISLSEETMMVLLGSNQLNVLDERQAVDALWSWAQTKAFIENKSDKDYIKSKASKLIALVRSPLVKDANENDPWFYLIDGNLNIPLPPRRRPAEKVSLISFSSVLKLSENSISRNEIITEKFTSIQFSVNRLTFLTGLAFHVEPNQNISNSYYNDNFDIYVNCSYVFNHYRMEEIRRGNQDETCKWFPLSILTEFDTPVLLSPVDIHTVAIKPPEIRSVKFSVPVYKAKCGDTHTITSITDPDTVFTVWCEVCGVVQLYYLPK